MPAGGWRYLAQRLDGNGLSDEFIDLDLPLQDVAITDTLTGAPAITAAITPEVARLQAPDGRPLFEKWGTAIYAENEGEIRGGAILTDLQREGSNLALTCTGFSSYPDGQPWTTEEGYIGVEVDPLDVVRVIWDHLQSQPYGNLGVEIDRTTKTPFRIGTPYKVREFDPQDDPNVGPTIFESGPVLLRWYETQDLGEEIIRYAEDTPFDYRERHAWVGDRIHHYIDFGYPNLGSKRTDLRFVIGENIMPLPRVGADEYATEIMALGAGEGRGMKRAVASRPGKLRRAALVIDKSARRQARVNNLAQRELNWRTGQDDITQVIVSDHAHAPLGSYSVGDEILVEGRTPWGDLDVWARVVSIGIRPAAGDVAELTLLRSDKIGA